MIQRPRGTRDFAPREMAIRKWAKAAMGKVFDSHGYGEIQTPVFEDLALFTAKSGDGIKDELYNFKDKGDREITLRPELTAPAMRMYFTDHQMDPKPIKWSYFQSCYRYDRPQKGRYREFWQYGCELIGTDSPLAYAELMGVALECFNSIGLRGVELRVGHVLVLRAAVDRTGITGESRKELMRAIDKGDAAGIEAKLGDKAAALSKVLSAQTIQDAIKHIPEKSAELESLGQTLDALRAAGYNPIMDLSIARGLDYYSGIVFEGHFEGLGAEKQVLGGGGYDLSAIFDAKPTPTIGFGLGFDRALVALEGIGELPVTEAAPLVAIGAIGVAGQTWGFGVASALRKMGHLVDFDLLGRKPAAVAKNASARNAKWLLIVGDRDLEAGVVRIKNLAESTETEVPIAEVTEFLS